MDRLKYKEIDDYFQQLLGMKAWGVRPGVGSFVTIEFGEEVREQASSKVHGEWHLWIYMATWDVYKNQQLILDSEDDKIKMELILKQELEGKALTDYEVVSANYEIVLEFDNNLDFFTYSRNDPNGDLWLLFTPDKKVLSAGPGKALTVEDQK